MKLHTVSSRCDAPVSSLIVDAPALCSVTRQDTEAVINDLPQRRRLRQPPSVRPSVRRRPRRIYIYGTTQPPLRTATPHRQPTALKLSFDSGSTLGTDEAVYYSHRVRPQRILSQLRVGILYYALLRYYQPEASLTLARQ